MHLPFTAVSLKARPLPVIPATTKIFLPGTWQYTRAEPSLRRDYGVRAKVMKTPYLGLVLLSNVTKYTTLYRILTPHKFQNGHAV